MRTSTFFILSLVLNLSLFGQKDTSPIQEFNSSNSIIHTAYLIGDAGELDDPVAKTNYVLDALKKDMDHSNQASTLVFLGDNLYPYGLPKKKSPLRQEMEDKLQAQLDVTVGYQGQTVFIPGNHDWNKSHKGGLKAVKRQEKFIQGFDEDDEVRMYPNKGCGDPKVVEINKDLVFIYIDSQWWLQDWSKEKEINDGCEIKSRGDFLNHMNEIIVEHKNDQIILFMHHPPRSDGLHGGRFSAKHHIFPLHETKLGHIPLPVIGSLYPIYRSVSGSTQDIPNAKYQELIMGIESSAKNVGANITFCSGHEHSLQYFDEDKFQFLVSGSGSKTTYLSDHGDAEFAQSTRGYAKLLFLENNETWLEIISVDPEGNGTLAFRKKIRQERAGTLEGPNNYPPIAANEKTLLLPASEAFEKSSFHEIFFGDQYRDVWSTPVNARIIDLETELGGVEPIKKGGGMASNSLRMQAKNGKQYILRSIEKDYSKLVPDAFIDLDILNVITDQNSASHPYGALIVPPLSKEVGIYYSNPKLVYLKHQRGLGNYNDLFPEGMYLLEERPNGDWSDKAHFGNSSDIISTFDVIDKIQSKKRHYVDQEWVLKSRIFDLLIHDFDRHDDQWRWASFENADSTFYRPIPRDRDQVFYKFKGFIPGLIGAFGVKKFKDFKHELKDAKNQSFNARYFDRYFLNQLDYSSWQSAVEQIQADLTDQEIIDAVNELPTEISQEEKSYISERLISRRDQLERPARDLYNFISKEVEVIGTDNDDIFTINRLSGDKTEVIVHTTKKDEKILKFQRVFDSKTTKEIRLFGLYGKDEFSFQGDENSSIRVRVIGGEDKDKLINQSESKKPIVYDDLKGMKIDGNFKDRRSGDIDVNEYDRKSFRYNTSLPLLQFGVTQDEGLWLGAGYTWTNHAWRKDPFKSRHQITAKAAPFTRNAFYIDYFSEFNDVIGSFSIKTQLELHNPSYQNYFGFGNGSSFDASEEDRPFNWVRYNSTFASIQLMRLSSNDNARLYAGPVFSSVTLLPVENRILDLNDSGFQDSDYERGEYFGFTAGYQVRFKDDKLNPQNGLEHSSNFNLLRGLNNDNDLSQFSTELRSYIRIINKPQVVLANRIGLSALFGDGQLTHYPSLGNSAGLRGYRDNRFIGKTSFSNNTDLRIHLVKWQNTLAPMKIGLTGGFDIGRVWAKDKDFSFGKFTPGEAWHNSVTAGVTFNILDIFIVHPYYTLTSEQNQFTLRMGHYF